MGFINDLYGAITAGKFYHNILERPMKKAWVFYLLLLSIIALIAAIYGGIKFTDFYNKAAAFFEDRIKTIEFSDGKIINMPVSHKELQFNNWTIFVDTAYVDKESFKKDLDKENIQAFFIGPETAFIVSGDTPIAINYPQSFSTTVNMEKLNSYRLYLIGTAAIAILLGMFIYKFIIGLVFVLLVIAPVTLFKFRRMGLAYSGGFQVG